MEKGIMELFNKIKDLRASAFKSGDKFLHSVLTNVFSDANPVGAAADQGAPADESVVAIIKKHLKGVVETLEALAHSEVHPDVITLKQREKEILESLLPKQLNAAELMSELTALVPKSLKDWMAHLKTNFAGLYDGKLAKQVFETEQSARQDLAPLTQPTVVGDTQAAPVQGVAADDKIAETTPVAAAVTTDDAAPSSTEPVVAVQ